MMLTGHGIRFTTDLTASGASLLSGGKHTYADWGLVPTSIPVVQPPPDLTPKVKIPGAREIPELRLTGLTGGRPVFGMRTGSWEFSVKSRKRWPFLYSEIANYLQGNEVLAVLDDQKSYYYVGTVSVDSWDSKRAFSTVSMKYSFRPYKYDIVSSLEPWLWDPFCFIDGVIRDYRDIPVDEVVFYTVNGSPLPVSPVFTASGSVSVIYDGTAYALAAGTPTVIPAINFAEGEHTITFRGSGTVSIDYRGGRL